MHAFTPSIDGRYIRLAVMVGVAFVVMYLLMYAMVETLADATANLDQLYMAGLMASSMVVVELAVMGDMYPDKRANLIAAAIGVVATIVFFLFIRRQTGVTDKQLLRAMISHHSSAVLMCERATVRDPRVAALCRGMVDGQRVEIAQMKALLHALENKE